MAKKQCGSAPSRMYNPAMSFLAKFGSGVAGAFVTYCLIYRETRIKDFTEAPAEHWVVLFVDLFIFLGCGGLLASFMADPQTTTRQAFITGCSWQGILGGILSGAELRAMKKAQTRRPHKQTPSQSDQESPQASTKESTKQT
jgi:hypothetical protein